MDTAKELVIKLVQKNKSHVGYGLQEECEALVGHILQNIAKSSMPELEPELKNDEDSIRYREVGNQHFVMGDDIEAIESYTTSLAYANSEELMAYAHANRSAALYRKQMYRECLIDIDTALGLGYPEEKKRKLKERGAKAVEELKKSLRVKQNKCIDPDEFIELCLAEKAKENSVTVRYKNGAKPEEEEDESKDNCLDEANTEDTVDEKTLLTKEEKKKPRYLEKEGELKLRYGPSKEIPALSDGIVVKYSEKYGRHLIATKEFKPGDIVGLEDPYAHVIYTDRYYKDCHYCLARSYNLIPCIHCPVAVYCSEKCRDLDWESAHQTECPILGLLPNLLAVDKNKIRMLIKIVRLLSVATANGTKVAELREDLKIAESNPDERTAGFTEEGILDSGSARSALSLATNITTRPIIGTSAFACISALAAILLATETNFFSRRYKFEELKDISDLPDLKFCGSIMFRACVVMSANCFSVQQEPGIKSGSGLYVAHSLCNHSCAPNTFRHFEGLTMITRALEPILPGDQIFTGYGAGYAFMPRTERREKIMQDYFFECDCPACANDWPMYNVILREHVGSISKNKELVAKLKPYRERLLKNMYDIDAVKTVLDILYRVVTQPCEEIVHAEQYLKSYYLDP